MQGATLLLTLRMVTKTAKHAKDLRVSHSSRKVPFPAAAVGAKVAMQLYVHSAYLHKMYDVTKTQETIVTTPTTCSPNKAPLP